MAEPKEEQEKPKPEESAKQEKDQAKDEPKEAPKEEAKEQKQEVQELYKPKGEIKVIKSNSNDRELEIYVVGKGENAICAFYDVFGFHNLASDEKLKCDFIKSNNTLEFFDRVCEAGNGKYMVFVPNYLRDNPLSRKPDWSKFGEWWDTTGNLDKVIAEFTGTVIPFIKKEYNVNLIATIGQCWGGNLCFKAGKLDNDDIRGIVTLHGARVNEEDCNALKKPVYYVQTDGDFDKDKAAEIINKKEFGKQCKFEKSDQAHGFTSSGGKYGDAKWVETNINPVVANITAFLEAVFVNKK